MPRLALSLKKEAIYQIPFLLSYDHYFCVIKRLRWGEERKWCPRKILFDLDAMLTALSWFFLVCRLGGAREVYLFPQSFWLNFWKRGGTNRSKRCVGSLYWERTVKFHPKNSNISHVSGPSFSNVWDSGQESFSFEFYSIREGSRLAISMPVRSPFSNLLLVYIEVLLSILWFEKIIYLVGSMVPNWKESVLTIFRRETKIWWSILPLDFFR